MFQVVIPLDQIIIDPERSTSLTTLPVEEAIETIRNHYAFVSKGVQVAIERGLAVITFPDLDSDQLSQRTQKTFRKAQEAAQAGEYRKAANLFKEVLGMAPWDVDARRNLAMALLESGAADAALDHLIDVLRLQPQDAWAHLLVANIYQKNKENLRTAEVYYKSALEIAPDDPYALSSYGALLSRTGREPEAVAVYRRAIAAKQDYPNPYLGLALLAKDRRDYGEVLAVLEELFQRARSSELRSQPVLAEAYRSYGLAQKELAARNVTLAMSLVDTTRSAVESMVGTPIQVTEDPGLTHVDATSENAWNHGRKYHKIRYRPTEMAIVPHLLMHELEHVILEDEAYRARRARSFATTAASQARAYDAMSDYVNRLRKQGRFDTRYQSHLEFMFRGLCTQLFNYPIDMVIEKRLRDEHALLRPSQFLSLLKTHSLNARGLKDQDIARVAPPVILRANMSMNCSYALMSDWLYEGATAYSSPYESSPYYGVGKRLLSLFLDVIVSFKPGDEYELVDEFAKVLKLEGWYEWAPARLERGSAEVRETPEGDGGPSNPGLLKEKAFASVMYFLDAFKTFDGMSPHEIRKIAVEIAGLGAGGLDYSSSDRKYTLKSMPGHEYSGLHLMCMMYAAFKRVDPALDTGLDLEHEYRQALSLYEGQKSSDL